jgi:hypothetical protein
MIYFKNVDKQEGHDGPYIAHLIMKAQFPFYLGCVTYFLTTDDPYLT